MQLNPVKKSFHSKKYRPLALALLAGIWFLSHTSQQAYCALPMPDVEAFWLETREPDVRTMALWTFDETGKQDKDIAEDDIEAMVDGLFERANAPKSAPGAANVDAVGSVLSTKIVELAIYETVGDNAKIVPDGKFGSAMRLGPDSYLSSMGLALSGEQAVTIDFWLNPDAIGRRQLLLDFPLASDEACRLWLSAEGYIVLENSSGQEFKHSQKLDPGVWRHIALFIGGKDGVSLLVDGKAEQPAPENIKDFPADPPGFGREITLGGAQGKDGFAGKLDQARVSKRKRRFYELSPMPRADEGAPGDLALFSPWFSRKLSPVFELTFDGNFPTSLPDQADLSGKYRTFEDGARGNAAVFHEEPVTAEFSDSLPAPNGTLEFWLKPLDWNNFASYCQYGNDGSPPRTRLFEFTSGLETEDQKEILEISAQQGHQQPQHGLPRPVYYLHPGRWTHVLIAWNGNKRRIYLDGKQQSLSHLVVRQVPANKAKAADYETDGTLFRFYPGNSAIDELRVFNWAFDNEEAANAYARFFPDRETAMAKLAPLSFDLIYDYYRERLRVNGRALTIDNVKPQLVRATIYTDTKTEAGTAEPNAEGMFSLTLPATLEYEKAYKIKGEILVDNETTYAFETNFSRSTPEWWQNELGKDRIVPDPWAPISVEDRTLSVWGRTFELNKAGLPVQIVSADAELLSAPFTMRVKTAEGEAEFIPQDELKFDETSPDRVLWNGRATGQGIKAEIEGELEFDGLLRLKITLRPENEDSEIPLETLNVDIPLTAEYAPQIIANGGGGNFRASWFAKFLSSDSGRIWDSKSAIRHKGVKAGHFLPVVWIGDDARGICFFGENDRGWTPHPEESAQEALREGDTIIYRMRIISRPVALSEAREFEIFIHPTPTKPLPEGWRGYNRGVPPVRNLEAIDAFVSQTLTAPADMPTHAGITFELEPRSWEDAEQNSKVVGRFGEDSPRLFYIDYSWPKLGPSMQEFMQIGLWGGTGRMAWTREVEDYFTWIINGYISRGLIEGIYIDDTSLGSTLITRSTAYELADGTIQPGFNTMGFRRFLKRVWILFYQRGQRAHIVPHMTYCYEIPALSFADAVVNGEDRDLHAYTKRTTLDVWPYNLLRIMGGSEKWGFVQFWKSGVRAEKARGENAVQTWLFWQNRAMKGAMILHDMEVMWGAKAGSPELTDFGVHLPGTRFIRHDEAVKLFHPDNESIFLSAYQRDNKWIVTIVNPTAEELEISLRADESIIGGVPVWSDPEENLLPPDMGVASDDELKNLSQTTSTDLGMDIVGQIELSEEDAESLLNEPVNEEDKKRERLAPKIDGSKVILPVRPKDYRMLKLEFK